MRHLADTDVISTAHRDYRYRLVVPKRVWASNMFELSLEQEPSLSNGEVAVQVLSAPTTARPGSTFTVELLVRNQSGTSLRSCPPNPVHLCYHWLDAVSSQVVIFDGERTALDPALAGRSERRYRLFVRAPLGTSKYRLRATLVQEHIAWWDYSPVQAFADILIKVG